MRRKLKILIIMTVALGMSSIASNTVFIAATPYVNKPFLSQVIRSPGVAFQSTRDYIAAIGKGRAGVQEYQQQRVEQYVADQSQSGSGSFESSSTLPPPKSTEDFSVRGYTTTGNGIYAKQNVAANSIEIYFSADAKFGKQTIQVNGQSVEAWVPL
jgi:hypothetical protein